jgi:drug/metabolite transporter (DMT)-like permease
VNALSIGLALLGGFLFAIGSVLQQKGAMEEPDTSTLRAGFLLRLIRRPVWLSGVVADALGYVAQAAALGVGKLVVVQPLMVSSVVFALPLGVWLTHQHVGRREIAGAGAVVIGLAAFMVVANPSGGRDDATGFQWAIAGGVVAAAAVALTAAAWRRGPALKAALTGTAAGILFGFGAALVKSTVVRFDDSFSAVFLDWHIYALAAVSLAGFVLVQVSLHTGALAPAITTSMVFETVVGVVVGVTLLDENLHTQSWGLAVIALGLALMVAGVVALALPTAASATLRPAEPRGARDRATRPAR